MGFEGVVFSDDLSMAGAEVAGGYAERARLSLQAGCDMVLVCNNAAGADEVLYSLEDYNNPVSQLRLVRLHGRPHDGKGLFKSAAWKQAVAALTDFLYESGVTESEELFPG